MFSSLFSGEEQQERNPADEVIQLATRLQSAVMLDDRRSAVRALKSMSKQFKVEIGSHAMSALIDVLRNDRADTEITSLALETIIHITTAETTDNGEPSEEDVGVMFTEIFVKETDNVLLLLALLEEFDFYVRYHTVKLLTTLLANRPRQLQNAIMEQPVGISRLMDLLTDQREVIRNESLLLMVQLTKSNANIQKIVAFESAFEKILDIIASEEQSEGNVVVQDSLVFLYNLLNGNVSNQNLFRETSCMPRVAVFFELEKLSRDSWDAQTVANIMQMLRVVRLLVSPDNPQSARQSSQHAAHAVGLLMSLLRLAFASNFPSRPVVLATVAELIRGLPQNQDVFASPVFNNTSPLIYNISYAFNMQETFEMKRSAIYCFLAYLNENNKNQVSIVSALQQGTAVPQQNIGILLCQGLLAPKQDLTNWASAICLSHILLANTTCKETLLQVALTREKDKSESLLTIVASSLGRAKSLRQKTAFLILLVTWLYECAFAVKVFLGIPEISTFLVTLCHDQDNRNTPLVDGLTLLLLGICMACNDNTSQTDGDAILQIIRLRVGEDDFLSRLERCSKSDSVSKASEHPELQGNETTCFLSMELAKLLRAAVDKVKKTLLKGGVVDVQDTQGTSSGTDASVEYHGSVVQQYKDLIKSQDEELTKVKAENELLRQQLQQQPAARADTPSAAQTAQIDELTQRVAERTADVERLQQQLSIAQLSSSDDAAGDSASAQLIAGLQKQVADLQQQLAQQQHAQEKEQLQQQQQQEKGAAASETELELQSARAEQATLSEENFSLRQQLEEVASKHAKELAASKKELTDLNSAHEELLVFLSEENERIQDYRARIVELGGEVSDEEELDTTVEGDD